MDPPPSNGDYYGYIIRIILGSSYIPIIPLLQGGGVLLRYVYGEFPEIRGTFLGVPITRMIIYWGLYWGSLSLGSYHVSRSA